MQNLSRSRINKHKQPKLLQLCSSLKLASRLPSKREHCDATSLLESLTGDLGQSCLLDCLNSTAGNGAGLLGLLLCEQVGNRPGELVVVDTHGTFFPPVALGWGIDAQKLLVVRPKSNRDGIAAAELALRSPAVSAVWASLDRVDPKASRRLLLASESTNAFGVLVRSAMYQADPSWADVQILCDPQPTSNDHKDQRLVRATQTRNRHGPLSGSLLISMDWRTGKIQAGINHLESKHFDPNSLPLAT